MIVENQVVATPARRQRNWWKMAFFVMLLMFELAREWAVIASAEVAQPNAPASLFSYSGYTIAEGRWRRLDGGSPIVPSTVAIDCRREHGRCIEATTTISDRYVYAPKLDWFDATFSQDAITYENDVPDCARYSVRLDLKLKKVFAVRERKDNPSNPTCAKLEPQIEMHLSDGHEGDRNPLEGHFVPLFSGVRALLS